MMNGKQLEPGLKIFADKVEKEALDQIHRSIHSPAFESAVVRIMPDVHAGKGSVIGFTAHITNGRVIPNVVGVDIGCGMHVVQLREREIDLRALDDFICREIPSGMNVYPETSEYRLPDGSFDDLRCAESLKHLERLLLSRGTLGGGNHFIEVDKDDDGNLYLVIHSGSRNIGKQVAEHYQRLAIQRRGAEAYAAERCSVIAELTALGRQREIQKALRNVKKPSSREEDLAYLEGQDAQDYLHDMEWCVGFAVENRSHIAQHILQAMHIDADEASFIHVIHNYIEVLQDGSFIIRKGAIRALEGEAVLIPLNMQHGCILGKGKGNPDWNYSAPHGAGRRLSRSGAFRDLSLTEFRKRMSDIYSTSVCSETLDESPMAYKDPNDIMQWIGETVSDARMLKPIYNFKAH